MKRLFLKLFLLGALVLFILALGIPLLISSMDDYGMAALDKRRLLRESVPPRIIFVGGSNLAFGLDSKSVEVALGMPVINMGLDAELGLRYILFEVKPYITRSDIIVIIPEYEHFYGKCFDGDYMTSVNFINLPDDRRRLMPFKLYFSILNNYPRGVGFKLFSLFAKPFCLGITDGYSRKGFNAYGDYVGHLNMENQLSKIKAVDLVGELNKDVIPELNNFAEYARKTGARLYLIYPSLIEKQYRRNIAKISMLGDILDRKIEFPILSKPQDYVMSEDCFYDTVYHLNSYGIKIRTQKIIADLRSALNVTDKERK